MDHNLSFRPAPGQTPFFLPDAVDQLALEAPTETWVKILEQPPDGGDPICRDVTFSMLAAFVNSMASWIGGELAALAAQDPTLDTPVVAFVGANDIRYPVVMLALMKMGRKPLLLSPRNSLDSLLALLGATDCRVLLSSGEFKGLQDHPYPSSLPFARIRVPKELGTAFTSGLRPMERPAIDLADTVLILHTSGTTSACPGPVYIPATAFHTIQKIPNIPTPSGRQTNIHELYNTGLLVSSLPLFHIFGGIQLLCRTLYARRPMVLLDPRRPATAESVLDAIRISKATSVAAPPSILEDIYRLPGGLKALCELECIFYGGAPLAEACGDAISAKTRLNNGMGSTEAGGLPSFIPADPKDWSYFEWVPESGIVMVPLEDSDPSLAEMVIVRHPSPEAARDYQFVFHNFDAPEWRTKDLFERHPHNPGLWRYVSRVDDLIVLSNGEKVNPVAFEKIMERHPAVKGALLFGAGRFQTGLLIESDGSTTDAESKSTLTTDKITIFEDVWSHVRQANALYPTHGRVSGPMVLLAKPEKPFKRTAKGTIVRRLTEQLYEQEIADLYDEILASDDLPSRSRSNAGTEPSVATRVAEVVRSVFQLEEIDDDMVFFDPPGADSLSILHLAHSLSAQLSIRCSPQLLYKHPTVKQLSQVLFDHMSRVHSTPAPSSPYPVVEISREQHMSAMIHEYTESLFSTLKGRETSRVPSSSDRPLHLPSTKYTTLLVGSTGSLGTHLLEALLRHSRVGRIFCLNRDSYAVVRQVASFEQREFPTDELVGGNRVVFLSSANLTADNFGLSRRKYKMLVETVDIIIHNAWPVNFAMPLSFFVDSIKGVVALARLAVLTKSTMIFVSSVASCMNYAAIRRDPSQQKGVVEVPEEFDPDHSMPARQGYGESKHVAECILAKVAERYSVETVILRVGQLAGSTWNGHVWNQREWIPSLILTSKAMRIVPMSLPHRYNLVDWIPVNKAAGIIAGIANKIVTSRPKPGDVAPKPSLSVFHIVNPKPVPWVNIARQVREFYGPDKVQGIDYQRWLEYLKFQASEAADESSLLDRFPALRLLEFFEEMGAPQQTKEPVLQFSCDKAREMSEMMSYIPGVFDNSGLLSQWLREWESDPA